MSSPSSSHGVDIPSIAATYGGDDQSIPLPVLNMEKNAFVEQSSDNTNFSNSSTFKSSIINRLLNTLPENFNDNLKNDPNFNKFLQFHQIVNNFFKESSSNSNNWNSDEIPKYDWETLSTTFEYIYKLYNDEINQILSEFDKLDIKRSIWQESAFRMDAERASIKFKNLESWISNQDLYLNISRKDLSSSVQIIKNTLNKLNNPANDSNSNNLKKQDIYSSIANSTPL
jgi:hypothetical protein